MTDGKRTTCVVGVLLNTVGFCSAALAVATNLAAAVVAVVGAAAANSAAVVRKCTSVRLGLVCCAVPSSAATNRP